MRLGGADRALGGAGNRPGWFPDWRQDCAILIGAGPSLTEDQCAAVRGRGRVLALNRAVEFVPWADALYACDFGFWKTYPQALAFRGLKVSQDARACEAWPDIRRVVLSDAEVLRGGGRGARPFSLEPGVIGSGGNSGFQALNLAVQFGARRIVLLGFDMTVARGTHFHGDHPRPLANPSEQTCSNWRAAFERARPQLRRLGVTVINATPGSALDAFQRVPLERAFG